MTVAGPPVTVGGIAIGPGVRVGGTSVGGPVVAPGTGGGATNFDDLDDVDAPPGTPGVLERQGDGIVRAVPRQDLTTEWFNGYGPPGVVLGAGRGDMYLDLDTGELYQLT